MNGPVVERKLATLILFVWLNILCHSLLWRHVCVAVWSCSHWLLSVIEYLNIKQLWRKKYFTWKCPTLFVSSAAVRICSRSSYLLTFVDTFAYNQQLTFLTHPVCKTTRRVMWTGTLGNATSTAVVLRARVQRISAYMFLLLHWSTAVVVGFHGAGPILRNFSGCTISKVHVWCNALTLSKVSTS